jgi:H+/Cl- antiporter ClcA
MEGIRLRSDSTGSTKSAFYQGTIVSAPSNSDGSNPIEKATFRHRRARKALNKRSKEKKAVLKEQVSLKEVGDMAIASLVKSQDVPELSAIPNNLSPLASGGYNPHNSQLRSKLVNPVARGFVPMQNKHGSVSELTNLETILDPPDKSPSEGEMEEALYPHSGNLISRDSLRYSDTSNLTPVSQQVLLGACFVEDTPPAETRSSEKDPKLAADYVRFDAEPDPIEFSIRSSYSADSGVYFQYPSPSGSLEAPSYPVQHTNNNQYPNYGTSGEAFTLHSKRGQPHISGISVDSALHSRIDEEDEESEEREGSLPFSGRLMNLLDPSDWLSADVKYDKDGTPYFDDDSRWTLAGIVRAVLYNPVYPEFTSLQQFSWAVILGIFMGVYTALWKALIEGCVDFMWKDVPERLLVWGFFTDLNGSFPVYHYMWIVPALFGGSLSYIFAALPTPIPGQNDWIHNLHSRGVQRSETFGLLFILSTAGMASGLSLGPELPLILTAGMIGSWLGVLCKQSMLQARVLNLTAAAAAIGGFFGFPMAGALFVLEVPHRMGLQYFEALSPATIASIVAVLTNRLVTGNDVTGYYEYPFLNQSLPSHIFKDAIVYGLFGGALGIFYTNTVLLLKHGVHDMFHEKDHGDHGECADDNREKPGHSDETIPLVGRKNSTVMKKQSVYPLNPFRKLLACAIPHKPTRAAVSGSLVGVVVGVTCIFIPHVMFWGEAQLQSLIDKGRTPLPVFGRGGEPSAGLVALGYCMVDQESAKSGFSLGCSAAITLAKIFVTGLSLGTGIVGGHFWAPLFVGCAASHFLTDLMDIVSTSLGFTSSLSAYPCVAVRKAVMHAWS